MGLVWASYVRWAQLVSACGIKGAFTPTPHFKMKACHIQIDTNLLLALLGPVRGQVGEQRDVWQRVFDFRGLRNTSPTAQREEGHQFRFADYVTTDGVALCVHYTAERTVAEEAAAQAGTKWAKRLAALEARRCRRQVDDVPGPFADLPVGSRVVAFDPG